MDGHEFNFSIVHIGLFFCCFDNQDLWDALHVVTVHETFFLCSDYSEEQFFLKFRPGAKNPLGGLFYYLKSNTQALVDRWDPFSVGEQKHFGNTGTVINEGVDVCWSDLYHVRMKVVGCKVQNLLDFQRTLF